MSRPVVLLTLPIDPAGVALLETAADVRLASDVQPETLRREARDAQAIVVRSRLPDDLFDDTPLMRGAVRHGTGFDMIPIDNATRHGVAVANVPGVNAVTVAEIAIGLCLSLARRLNRIQRDFDRAGWAAARVHAEHGREMRGRTLGIVGVGAIGTALARIAHHGFGMRVLGHRRSAAAMPPEIEAASLDTLLAASDYVVLAVPLTDATRGMIGARELALMRPDAALVNVARGPVVDEAALVAALAAGRLGGAALDVFTEQPLARTHPLATMENVIVTPHVAGITAEAMRAMSEVAARDVLRMLAGELPRNLVNPSVRDAARARWAHAAPAA
jgi:D-3-phosphoglycerate dehydrogenase